MRLLLATVVSLVPLLAWADTPPIPTMPPPRDPPPRLVTGWGLLVTQHGRSLDLRDASSGWANDPRAPSQDFEAGFGWRNDHGGAVVGYSELGEGPGFARDDAHRGGVQTGAPGVLGLSLTLHGR